MGGGLMQLVAYGAQDIYLTGNPQITFFKVVYRRHTNFSMETIQQTLNGTSTNVSDNATATCTISRNGDLVHKTYVSFAATGADTNGSKLVKQVELEIGGQRIDRHYQEWNEVWNELSTPESKAVGLKAMQLEVGTGAGTGVTECQIPLNFWFCRNPGLALPLIALQYHEVKLKFTWGDPGSAGADPKVWCDYIYLDTDERRRFAQVSHEYLIEQLQLEEKTLTAASAETHKLNFNHPVKELIWTYDSSNRLTNVKIQLNGHDRFAAQPDEYFSLKQPLDYHTAVPRQNLSKAAQESFASERFIGLERLGATSQKTDLFTACASDFDMGNESTTPLIYFSSSAPGNTGGTGNIAINTLGLNETPNSGSTGANMAAKLTVGLTIALVVVAKGTHDVNLDVVASAAGAVGDVYFARVLAVGAAVDTKIGTALITAPTTIDGSKVLTDIKDATGAAKAGAQVAVYKASVTTTLASQARTSKMTRKIGVYSFALKPEEHQPSGTCNFSRIDNAQLLATNSHISSDTSLKIYAVNYNVLRIMSGMGGLAYSN